MLIFGAKNTQELVEKWNKALPIDKWYRRKYNIPFNSTQHRSVNLADMFFEFWEFIEERRKTLKIKNQEEKKQEPYIKGQGNFVKEIKLSSKDIDQLFDELDIDSMD